MTVAPSQDDPAARIQRALILVAARAALLRAALDADDPEDADEILAVAWDGLRAALDELEYLARALGDEEVAYESHTDGRYGGPSRTRGARSRHMAPPNLIPAIPPGEAILVCAIFRPHGSSSAPWFDHRKLRRLSNLETTGHPLTAVAPGAYTEGVPRMVRRSGSCEEMPR